jgi:DNA-directed RNA polymerase beta subunit
MTQFTQQQQKPQLNAPGAMANSTRAVQQFIADVLTEKPDKVYRLDDYDTIRQSIFDNVKSAVERRFPLRNDRFTLTLEKVDYDDPEDIDVKEQKRLLLNNKSSMRRLRGEWVLRDAASDKVVSRSRRMTLMNVPRMTSRGTFIRNGREYNLTNIMRLEPGVYCKQGPEEVSAQFNIKQGTGAGFNMLLNPKTGLFTIRRGTTNAPAYTVLHDMGVSDEQMQEAWGKDIFEKNRSAGISDRGRAAADKIYNM